MAQTPSKRRRKGREAFIPHENPMDHQPYIKGTWAYDSYLHDFIDGWKEAEKQWEKEQNVLLIDELQILKDCLELIEDMTRFVGVMALQDYQLLNEVPINLKKLIASKEYDEN